MLDALNTGRAASTERTGSDDSTVVPEALWCAWQQATSMPPPAMPPGAVEESIRDDAGRPGFIARSSIDAASPAAPHDDLPCAPGTDLASTTGTNVQLQLRLSTAPAAQAAWSLQLPALAGQTGWAVQAQPVHTTGAPGAQPGWAITLQLPAPTSPTAAETAAIAPLLPTLRTRLAQQGVAVQSLELRHAEAHGADRASLARQGGRREKEASS